MASYHKKKVPVLIAFSVAAMLVANVQAKASDDVDDDRTTVVLPSGINDLNGIDFKTESIKKYYSTNRTSDKSKQVVFYNLGTKKFLNYGGYWGSHAALSDVPQVFWLQRHNDDVEKQYIYDNIRYPETAGGQTSASTTVKTSLTDVLSLKKVNVGSLEGSHHSNATYKYIKIVNADGLEKVLTTTDGTALKDYSPAGATFSTGDMSIDFWNQSIEAEINLSGCTATNDKNLENLLTIGEDIANWNGGTASKLHFYVWKTSDGYTLRMQNIMSGKYPDNNASRRDVSLSTADLKIKLSAYGLFINGEKVYDTGFTAADGVKHDNTLRVASTQGNVRSNATYSDIKLTRIADVDFLAADSLAAYMNDGVYKPNGQPFKMNADIDFDIQQLTAKIDMSTAQHSTDKNENVISIGSDVQNWAPTNDGANIHFYFFGWPKDASGNYQKDAGYRLKVDFAKKGGKYQELTNAASSNKGEWLIPASKLIDEQGNQTSIISIVLNKDGLFIQGDKVEDTQAQKFIDMVLGLNYIEVGSCEGKERSHASYHTLKTERIVTDADKTLVKADDIQKGATFKSDEFSLGPNTLQTTIDVSSCQTKGETLLSIGNDVDNFTTGKLGSNTLHFYYQEKIDGVGYVMRVASASSSYAADTHNRYVKSADGKFSIALTTDGLTVNGGQVFLADDEIMYEPISYVSGKEGDVVPFLTDSENHPIVNENGKYTIDSVIGKGMKAWNTTYTYVNDSDNADEFNAFIYSNVQKQTSSSQREGQAMAWTPSLDNPGWGNVGAFIDRTIPESKTDIDASRGYAQWTLAKVSGIDGFSSSDNIYTISLRPNQAITELVKNPNVNEGYSTKVYPEGDKTFFLQADREYIYSSDLGGTTKGFYYNDTDGSKLQDVTSAEAEYSETGVTTDLNALWKVFTIEEYYRLFKSESSEMTNMLNLSFLLKDPDFKRENADLSYWTVEDTYGGTITDKLRIGYDGYYKNKVTDKDYVQVSSYKLVNKKVSNHARYMGVEAMNGARGRMYQDVELSYPGWYAISCRGLSNAGAKLFVQMINDDGTTTTALTTPLAGITDEERTRLNATAYSTDGLPGWPYDYYEKTKGGTDGMPFYNALVDMNDRNLNDGKNVEKYTSQVAIYIDPDDVNVDKGKTKKLRFGVMIDGVNDNTAQATTSTNSDEWTVFDNFELLFGGNSIEPNIVIDEDATNLDYIEKSIHQFSMRPLHLNRKFNPGKWNTLVLPVSLSESQFTKAFGDDAKLATLTGITSSTIEFSTVKSETSDGVFLQAMVPYIIFTNKSTGDHAEYTGKLATRESNGMKFIDVTSPANHFFIEGVTLAGCKRDESNQPYYELSTDYPGFEVKGSRTNEMDGIYLQSYGVICKTYEKRDGVNTIIEGRPDLKGGYVFKNSDMYRIKSQYGTKGLRCWFTPIETTTGSASQSLKVVIDGIKDDTTGLNDLLIDDGQIIGGRYAEGIYNLNGQKVSGSEDASQLPSGIYIVNGTKRVVGRR